MIVFRFGPAVDKVFCLLLKKRIICLLLICEVHQKYLLCPPGKGRKKFVACTDLGSLRCTIALCSLHNPHCAAQLHSVYCTIVELKLLSVRPLVWAVVESPHISWTKNDHIENPKKTCKNQNTPMTVVWFLLLLEGIRIGNGQNFCCLDGQ